MKNSRVRIIGVPQDLGQKLRGVDMGPSAMRYAGLRRRLLRLGYEVEDAGNVDVAVRDTVHDKGGLVCLPAIVNTCELVYESANEAIGAGDVPLFLGGDHSIAIGTIGGVTSIEPAGVLWIDAHADCNSPASSPSGNIHGMPLAALLGQGAPELVHLGRSGAKLGSTDVILVGPRDVDPGEKDFLKRLGVGVYTMREIDERGVGDCIREALMRLSHRERLHVSLDMDCLDPMTAPGVGTPVPGGLTYREAHLLMEILADDGRIASLDVVEINPMFDEKNRTATIAVELVASALGQRIL
ncbi:MAG: arginase [Acidobacteriota bacterium]|nr:MAG: arginase [Acidobacteriota bacterium]